MSLRVGIIGPGRRQNGTGEFVAKFLHAEGAIVTGVVASSLESARTHAKTLKEKYGITAKAYPDAKTMLNSPELDAVAVCTPAKAHLTALELALKYKKHVFCEKPLIWNDAIGNIRDLSAALVKNFYSLGLILHYNTQWTYALKHYEKLYNAIEPDKVTSFSMDLSPSSPEAEFMIKEAVPHANSLLLELGIENGPKDIAFTTEKDPARLKIGFTVKGAAGQAIGVIYDLTHMETQPRRAAFSINGNMIKRELDMKDGYRIFFSSGKDMVESEDPMLDSVRDFIGKTKKPATREEAAAKNMALLCDIFEAYDAASQHT